LSDSSLSPEDVANEVENVKLSDVITAAKSYELDTVYILSPDENALKEDTL
jgi:predicted Zn-dependent peptidase